MAYDEADWLGLGPNYVFYATYDQGSIKINTEKPLTWDEAFINFWNTYWIPIILVAIGIFFLWFVLRPRWIMSRMYDEAFGWLTQVTIPTEYKSVSGILDDILFVRNTLRQIPLSNRIFDMYNKWYATGSKLQLLNNDITDYFEIDNFFDKIKTRERLLHSTSEPWLEAMEKPEDPHSDKINKETLDACERCLFGIDWTKYK